VTRIATSSPVVSTMMLRLRPLIFLAGVVTAAGAPDGFRRVEELGADRAGGRDGLAGFGDANLFTQGVMDPGQGAVGGPDGEVVVDELRVREVDR
jgi:hypothetical protein